jgi:hypothetical protein
VRIETLAQIDPKAASADDPNEPILQKLARKFGGKIKGPQDWAENHGHYIHGTPKRKK